MTNPHRTTFAALAATALLALGACASSSDGATDGATDPTDSSVDASATDAATDFPVTVDHAFGSTEIPAEPERVVVASPTLTGHLLAIDAPVVAAQVLPASDLADENGFMTQWADVALERDVEPIQGAETDIESIAAARPDLIVGTAFGGDALTEDVYGLLSDIAPTLVIDSSGLAWEDLAPTLADATGRRAEAEAAVEEFEALVADAAEDLDTSHPVAPIVVSPEGINVLTPASAHGQLLADLGYEVVEVEGSDLEGEAGSATRSDVVSVSPELLSQELGDATLLFVFADEAAMADALEANPTLAELPAAAEGRTVALDFDSFRLDRYSATNVVETLQAAG